MDTGKAELDRIRHELAAAAEELIKEAPYTRPGGLFVLGCSTSEVIGVAIGKGSNRDVGEAIIEVLLPVIRRHKLHLAVQGCEHINRALVVEREIMLRHDLEEVNVIPQLHAGGACSMAAYAAFDDPVMVEHIEASLGMDIGDTEIGMHVRFVQRPVRLSVTHIGQARVTSLIYRPKLVGGERAVHHP
ncbi:MAG: TIGR01440 family protein [Clostridiaceae bacterium]|nr:TIGR01440 family protein [Clostridiaceae bacterium]